MGFIHEGVGRIFSNGGGINMLCWLCVWYEMWELLFVLMTIFG